MILSKNTSFSISGHGERPLERFAAEELKKYLSLLGLVEAENAGNRFIFSADETLGSEGFSIRIEENTVTLAGNGNGVLYGVYELLERYFGFCFATYTEIISEKEQFELPLGEYRKEKADLPYRTAIPQFSVWAGDPDRALTLPFIDWLAKNRYNRLLTWVSVFEGLKEIGMLPELEKRGIKLTVGHHQAIYTFLPPFGNRYFPEHYRETHPEYYRLEADGSRYDVGDYNGQLVLCCHNEECIETIANNAVQWLKENPVVDCLAFWPNDHTAEHCHCPECAPLTKTENYLYFENRLATKIREQLPHVKIDVLIYQDLWTCPEKITSLCDGVVIDQATWWTERPGGLRNCGAPDGSGIIGTEYARTQLSYRKICKNTVFYDYYMGNYNARQRLVPAADEMQALAKFMIQEGISGSGTQMECYNHWNNLLNFYSFARTMYDSDLDLEAILAQFCALFGKGAEPIKEILRMLEAVCDGQDSIRYMGIYTAEHIDAEKVYALFDEALSLEDRPLCRNHIRMLRMAFRYSQLITLDKTEDPAREPDLPLYLDPTGELAYMKYAFDSYHNKDSRSGIAIPAKNSSDKKPNSIWYDFE